MRLQIAGMLGLAAFAVAGSDTDIAARFQLVGTSSSDSARFIGAIEACNDETSAFRQVISSIPEQQPLVVHASDSIGGIVFGSAYESGTRAPRLSIRLVDLERLPTVSEVRTWHADSAWAFTQCEILGHELSEAVVYREGWEARQELIDSIGRLEVFSGSIRRAHSMAVDVEASIASEQRTRIDASGQPYGRGAVCVVSGGVHVLLGPHTETLGLKDGVLERIAYNANADLCSLL